MQPAGRRALNEAGQEVCYLQLLVEYFNNRSRRSQRMQADGGQMNVLFALPGLHRWDRGAEIAFISVANMLATAGEQVTLIGSGPCRQATAYHYIRAASVDRSYFNRFPPLPFLRSEYAYEESDVRAVVVIAISAIGVRRDGDLQLPLHELGAAAPRLAWKATPACICDAK